MATTIRLPLDLRNPQINANQGNSFTNVLGLTAYEASIWEFLKDVDGKIFGFVPIPANMAATPNAAIILSLAANATSGVTRFSVATARVADGATFNVSSITSETAIDTTVPGTAYFRKDVTFPASGNLAVTPVANDIFVVQIYHEGAHANDTLAVDTYLFNAYLRIDIA